jgi:hypothetical protein
MKAEEETVDAKYMFFDFAYTHSSRRTMAFIRFKRQGASDAQEKEWRRAYIALWVSRLESVVGYRLPSRSIRGSLFC